MNEQTLTFVRSYRVNGVRYEFPHLCPDVGKCAIARWAAAKHAREYFAGESSVNLLDSVEGMSEDRRSRAASGNAVDLPLTSVHLRE